MVRLMAGLRVVVGPSGDGGSRHIRDLDNLGAGNDGVSSDPIAEGKVEDGAGIVEPCTPVERSGLDGHPESPDVKRWPGREQSLLPHVHLWIEDFSAKKVPWTQLAV